MHRPAGNDGDYNGGKRSNKRRNEDKQDGFDPSRNDDSSESGARNSCAPVPPHKSVRRARGQAEYESERIPKNRAEQSCYQDQPVNEFQAHHSLTDGTCHGRTENEGGDEIPEGGPEYRAARAQDAGGNDGGDGIGGVMPTIGKVKGQRDHDDYNNGLKAAHDCDSAPGGMG